MNITLYPLGSYNNGILRPFTVELDGLTEEDYRGEIRWGLWGKSTPQGSNVISTKCEDCDHIHIGSEDKTCTNCGSEFVEHKPTEEEWIVCDYEDIPREFTGEYDLDPSFWDYAEFLETTHLDQEVVDAGIACGIDLDKIEDAYEGKYDSDEDFAQALAEETSAIQEDAQWPHTCIDWEWAARELMYDYCSSGGHYFRNL